MKKSLVLLVITLLAAAYVWYFEVRSESKLVSTDDAQQASTTLTGLKKDDIRGFTLQKTGGEAIALDKVQDGWSLSSPVKASADEGEVNSVLWDLEGVNKDATIEAKDLTPEKLASYGLDKPQGSIEVVNIDRATQEPVKAHFVLGGASSDGARIYVRRGSDGPVYLVDKRLAENLDKTVFQMRNKTIVSLVPTQIGAVKVFGESKLDLQKDGNLWNIKDPLEDYADPQTVQSLLKDVVALTIVSFASDDAAKFADYGLDTPRSHITVSEGAAGKSTTINFGKDAPDGDGGQKLVYASVGGGSTVFTLKADDVAKLFPALDTVRARTLLRMDPFMLKGATLTYGLDQIELKRPDYDWFVAKPYSAEASTEAVMKILDVFQNARISEYVTSQPDAKLYGFDAPRGSFSYTQADKPPVGIVFGGDAGEGFVYVKRTDTPNVFKTSGSLLNLLKTPALSLHTLDMQKVNFAKADTMTIQREDRAYTLKAQQSPYGTVAWSVTAPVNAPANTAMMTELAASLATTRAVEIVEDKPADLAVYGLDKPVLRLGMKMAQGTPDPKTLLIGKATDGGKRFAMLDGETMVFTVNSGFARTLLDEPRDPAIFQFKMSEATRVEFTKGETKYVFGQGTGGWVMQAPDTIAVDQGPILTELSHLSGLRTTQFVDFTTTKLAQYGLDKPQAVARVEMPGSVAALSIGNLAPSGHYYATSTTLDGVFLLTPGDVSKVLEPSKLAVKPSDASGSPEGRSETSQAAELEGAAAQPSVQSTATAPLVLRQEPEVPQATSESLDNTGK